MSQILGSWYFITLLSVKSLDYLKKKNYYSYNPYSTNGETEAQKIK